MKTKAILLLVFQLILVEKTALANTIHILVSGNTTDKSAIIRQSSKNDIKDISNLFNQIANTINYKINIIVFANEYETSTLPFTSKDILREINNLKVETNDIIFFYSHTHGWKSNDDFPQISLGKNGEEFLEVSSIREKIKTKQARLNLIMIHACNGGNKTNSINHIYRNDFENINLNRLNSLFLGLRGDITITSSHKEFVSWSYGEGGVSTTYIINNLIKMANGQIQDVSWHNLMNISCNEISEHFGSTPYYEINLNNEVKVEPTNNLKNKLFRTNNTTITYREISLKKLPRGKVYAKNISNTPFLLLVVYSGSNGQLKSSRLTKLNPNRGVYLRNDDFSYVTNNNETIFLFLKKINSNDPLHKVKWQGGNTVLVNKTTITMKQIRLTNNHPQ